MVLEQLCSGCSYGRPAKCAPTPHRTTPGRPAKSRRPVLCEYGPVAVSWNRSLDRNTLVFTVDVPTGAAATLRIPIDSVRSSIVVDDRKLLHAGSVVSNQVRIEGRFASIELEPGKHAGESRIEE